MLPVSLVGESSCSVSKEVLGKTLEALTEALSYPLCLDMAFAHSIAVSPVCSRPWGWGAGIEAKDSVPPASLCEHL